MQVKITATVEEMVAGTLRWCNRIRRAQGQPNLDDLPKGYKANGKSCPCGNAIGKWVGTQFFCELGEEMNIFSEDGTKGSVGEPLPNIVRQFVHVFDNSSKLDRYEKRDGFF